MMTTSKTIERNYWLGLSALFAVTVSVVAMADPPWSVVMVAALVLFAVLQGIHYKQIGRHIQGKLPLQTQELESSVPLSAAQQC